MMYDASWLKSELAKPGRSQAALARHMGIETSGVNRLANGSRRLLADEIATVQEYLGRTAPMDIRSMREAKGWSQVQLAEMAGTSQQTVHRVETGEIHRSRAYEDIVTALTDGSDAPVKTEMPARPLEPVKITSSHAGRVTLDIKANVSMGVAAQILALIEGDKA